MLGVDNHMQCENNQHYTGCGKRHLMPIKLAAFKKEKSKSKCECKKHSTLLLFVAAVHLLGVCRADPWNVIFSLSCFIPGFSLAFIVDYRKIFSASKVAVVYRQRPERITPRRPEKFSDPFQHPNSIQGGPAKVKPLTFCS